MDSYAAWINKLEDWFKALTILINLVIVESYFCKYEFS
jgi:hypothetical protein